MGRADLSILKTAVLGFSHTIVSRVYTAWCEKDKKTLSKRQLCGSEEMARVVQSARKHTVNSYNHSSQPV